MPTINKQVVIKKIWKDSSEIPMEDSDIIVVLNHRILKGADVSHYRDGRYTFHGFYGVRWDDREYKIVKWCYLEDVLNLE